MHYFTLFALFVLLNFGAATHATAATITSSPKDITVAGGGTFSVRYSIDPQGDKIYTTKLVLGFPAKALKVESFTFGGGWIPLSQPGYDTIDAVNGILIKTAGYPGGAFSPLLLATVQFRVLGTAKSTITVQDTSLVLNAQNENVLAKIPVTTTVTVATPIVTPIPPPEPTPPPEEEQNLFDVGLEVSSPQENGFNWAPWAVAVLVLCLIAICGTEVRKWYRKRGKS